MAILERAMSLTDKLRQLNPKSKQFIESRFYVELLNQDVSILNKVPSMEANNITSHQYKEQVLLPTVSARLAGEGTAPSKSESVTQERGIKIYSSLMKIDKDSYDIGGNGREYVAHEARMHMTAQDNKICSELFYGSATDVRRLSGLANTYNALTGDIGKNVISAGSVSGGDATSIWLVGLGGNGLCFTYPLGSPSMGFERTSSGQWQLETDSSNKSRFIMATEFVINRGYVVQDYRSITRICNIDNSAMLADTTGATINLANLMLKSVARVPDQKLVNAKSYEFFMRRSTFEALQVQLYNKSNAAFSYSEINGQIVYRLAGKRINIVDAILNTETTVS